MTFSSSLENGHFQIESFGISFATFFRISKRLHVAIILTYTVFLEIIDPSFKFDMIYGQYRGCALSCFKGR